MVPPQEKSFKWGIIAYEVEEGGAAPPRIFLTGDIWEKNNCNIRAN